MHKISHEARKPIAYTQKWVGDPVETKKKKKKEDPDAEPEYETGEFTIRLLPDVPGIVPWITPGTDGVVPPITGENFDEFLALVCHPDDIEIVQREKEAGHFGDAARFDCARSAWKNSLGQTDILNTMAKLNLAYEKLRLTQLQTEALIESAEPTINEELEIPGIDGEGSDDDTVPFDD